jgi:hypothetical protein
MKVGIYRPEPDSAVLRSAKVDGILRDFRKCTILRELKYSALYWLPVLPSTPKGV